MSKRWKSFWFHDLKVITNALLRAVITALIKRVLTYSPCSPRRMGRPCPRWTSRNPN
jgi:hypothetical protein